MYSTRLLVASRTLGVARSPGLACESGSWIDGLFDDNAIRWPYSALAALQALAV